MDNTNATVSDANVNATVSDAKAARAKLQQDLLMIIRDYETRYGLVVTNVNLNHSHLMGYRRQTVNAYVDIEL